MFVAIEGEGRGSGDGQLPHTQCAFFLAFGGEIGMARCNGLWATLPDVLQTGSANMMTRGRAVFANRGLSLYGPPSFSIF
jgi:hypothetical protein